MKASSDSSLPEEGGNAQPWLIRWLNGCCTYFSHMIEIHTSSTFQLLGCCENFIDKYTLDTIQMGESEEECHDIVTKLKFGA